MPLVAVVMGSKSDSEVMQPALDILKSFDIEYEVAVISAHRTPEKASEYAKAAKARGIEIIIAAAGGAAARTAPAAGERSSDAGRGLHVARG